MQVAPARIAQGILNQERRFLSRAITLTESSLPAHATLIGDVLRAARVAAAGGGGGAERKKPKPRVSITGSPGVGKSCIIEALGMHLVEQRGMTVGVLAVDPSDADRGGSVLGDKTRMDRLSNHPRAFVRPSPSKGALGGVTARCWEALEVFEAANFDLTIVETVGVGQSEIEARNLTDVFVLLVPPLGGDDLQGVKRGIVQAADLIAVTKADADNDTQQLLAEQAASFYRRSSSLLHVTSMAASSDDSASCHADSSSANGKTRRKRPTDVLTVSARTNTNIDQLADAILGLFDDRLESGVVYETRQAQRLRHFRSYLEQETVRRATLRLREQGMYDVFENQVATHTATPREAGEAALRRLGF